MKRAPNPLGRLDILAARLTERFALQRYTEPQREALRPMIADLFKALAPKPPARRKRTR